ncbi:Uncharacterised protein [Mycobacteroides abscessus subsp. abscessus]|uniref:hypothetical protein n=1 Tax=Mycobacteroides abscessus TaxID=36809 RepID=UPI00092A94C5|nr:hypothetical protein [Mycobacteroides abscessus]SHR99508.1 Uncharacterised protein [Mycobacteroides abscessus subsp. abscessus]
MTAVVSRVLLFTEPEHVAGTVAALAAITDTEPVTMRITRRDGTRVTAHLVEIGGTVIEVAPGEPAVPALLELLVPDLPAACDRLSVAGITTVATPERGGVRVRIGALTVSVRKRDDAYYAQFSRAVEAGDYEIGGPLEPGPAWEEREK